MDFEIKKTPAIDCLFLRGSNIDAPYYVVTISTMPLMGIYPERYMHSVWMFFAIFVKRNKTTAKEKNVEHHGKFKTEIP